MSDYLWDRSGSPDPEIERLEQLLSPLQLKSKTLPTGRRRIAWAFGAAAACLLAALLWPQRTDWVRLSDGRELYRGERVRADTEVAIESEEIGRIELQPGAEIRVDRQAIALRRGHLRALIWAPPRKFAVDMPSARAVDLGCQYDVSVDERGDGLLRVDMGWVAFQAGANESFIPAGAACRTTKARGPGIPWFEDASAEFRSALARLEQGAPELPAVLANARPKDGLTLWHLLSRVPEKQRGMVFDRFAGLVALPASVRREKATTLDRSTLDECWSALDLDDAEWWREWKRDWR